MTKYKSLPDFFDPVEEMKRELGIGEYFDGLSLEELLRATQPLRTDRCDFCDDEQQAAWERAKRGIAKGSKAELISFLKLGKPLSPRVADVLAHILGGSNLAAPNDFGEIERTLRIKAEIKSARPAHRPSDPATMVKACAVAKRVIYRLQEEPDATPTDVINELAEEAKVSPRNVWAAYRSLKETARLPPE